MPPHAGDCERAELVMPVPVHSGRRVGPALPVPAAAWAESEAARCADSPGGSPGESRRLLGPAHCLQDGLTLGVWGSPRKQHKCPLTSTPDNKVKTDQQKKREKLIAALRPPYFILSMLTINVGVHVFGSADVRAQLEWSAAEWWREPWRLLTYGWVHAGDTHLALNALVAVAVGWVLEREQGWRGVCAVWCAGVVGGALGAGALQPRVRVVGASAAVYALLTAHLPNVALRLGHIPLWWFRPLSVVVLAASEAGWALLHAQYAQHAEHAQPAHVAWAAHVFGAAVGVPVAFLVFNGEHASRRPVRVARALSALALLAGVALAACHYAAVAPAPPRHHVREITHHLT